MSDLSIDTAAPRIPRTRQSRQEIHLPSGEVLMPRAHFARDVIGVCERTAVRMNLPTAYVGGVAYVARDASLKIVAERVKRRNVEPAKRRNHRR
jgi:hypothetical protein